MSEQGWREFLHAEGVGDWVVLYGGATAVYDVVSLPAAAGLAGAVAAIDGLAESEAILTLSATRLSVRLTRGMELTEPHHVALARTISAVAKERGATADRAAAQEVQLAVAACPDELDLPFWRAVLGYDPLAEDNAVDPLGHGPTVWMQDLDPAKPLRHAMHVDVSVAREHAEARVAAAVDAGGRVVDDSEAPRYWVLADRAGNKVCVAGWPDGAQRPTESRTSTS